MQTLIIKLVMLFRTFRRYLSVDFQNDVKITPGCILVFCSCPVFCPDLTCTVDWAWTFLNDLGHCGSGD